MSKSIKLFVEKFEFHFPESIVSCRYYSNTVTAALTVVLLGPYAKTVCRGPASSHDLSIHF